MDVKEGNKIGWWISAAAANNLHYANIYSEMIINAVCHHF